MVQDQYERIETRFSLVAIYAYRENYGYDSPEDNWKNKGSSEVLIKDDLTLEEVNALTPDKIMKLIEESGKCLAMHTKFEIERVATFHAIMNTSVYDTDSPRETLYSEYTFSEYLLDERSESTLQRIREALSKEQGIIDYGYLVFTASEYEMSESTMEWGLHILKNRGIITWDGLDHHPVSEIQVLIPLSKEENSQNDFEDIENTVHARPRTGRVRF